MNIRSSGGIGRRVGLKIQSGFTLGASSSLAWSKSKRLILIDKSFLCYHRLEEVEGINLEDKRPTWTSRYTFILAAVGSAVGLGNIWRFPYVMGQNGGAIFLIVYLLLISTICFVPLMAELFLGRLTKKECVGAY